MSKLLNPELGGLSLGQYSNYTGTGSSTAVGGGPASTGFLDGLANTFGKGFNYIGENQKSLGDLAGLAGSLANTFAGFKQLGLAEDTFNFNKAMKEKEYAMAKDAYDRNVKRATSIGNQMRAGGVN